MRTHVIPALGARKRAQLSAEEVDQWLATKAKTLSTDTLHRLLSILRQSIRRAQARDLVKRNVALLCDVPRGTAGRPPKSLTLAQAADLLTASPILPPALGLATARSSPDACITCPGTARRQRVI